MAKLYDFRRLIHKYSVKFEAVHASEGAYVSGHYQEGLVTVTEMHGAIVPLAESKLYKSGGSYTAKDRQLYLFTPITSPLKNTNIRYKGQVYSVEQETDFDDYADVYIYLAKWVKEYD